ncbi:MAG: cadherin repeat domain-containing protein [Burkholderiaceae bacterium]
MTTVTATDADLPAQAMNYSIVGGADAALFTIDGVSGVLGFLAAPDYETPLDAGTDNVYDVTVQVDDGAGGTDTQAISITVFPVNDNDPVITSDGGGATATVNVAENTTAVTTVTATDADLPAQTMNYSIVGGADAALFTIDGVTGALSFLAAPDYEGPADTGADNVYDVTVQADDGAGRTDTQAIAVSVTPVNDNPPVITSDGGGASASLNVAENTTAVTTVTATDADLPAQAMNYSIVGGADAALFTIDGVSGALGFVAAPDYETPLDAGSDNVYDVTVQVDDGNGLTDTQAIAVTVANVNEPPVITSDGGGATAGVNVAENVNAVTLVTSIDVDGGAPNYTIAGGADAAFFTIDNVSGALSFLAARDYESPLDAGTDNVYDVTVQVDDGSAASTPRPSA